MEETTKTSNGRTPKQFYKGLEQAEGLPEFTQWQGDEFPHRKSIPDINRRDILKLVGGSILLAGLSTGCRFLPEKKIVPFVIQPEDAVAGIARHFTSAFAISGYSTGILVESNGGRPTKIEGNPLHPASLGGANAFAMAETLNLYDPDRLQVPLNVGDPASWRQFFAAFRKEAEKPGASIAILTETVGSKSLVDQINRFIKKFPGTTWTQYEPVNRDNVREGAILAFGKDLETRYMFDKAKVVLTVDSDFVQYGPAPVRYAHDLMQGRNAEANGAMNRIYSVEAFPTLVGSNADHRLPLRPSQMLAFVKAIAAKVGVSGVEDSGLPQGVDAKWIDALVKDLQATNGECVVIAGDHHSPNLHALVHAVNEKLGAFGKTVEFSAPVLPKSVNQLNDLTALKQSLEAMQVKILLVLGGNPAFTAPADFKLAELIRSVPFSAHLGLHDDETSEVCTWQLPMSHFLESWDDGVAYDGTKSIVQPLISPIYETKTSAELLESLMNGGRNSREIVQDYWRATSGPKAAAVKEQVPGAPVTPEKASILDPFESTWNSYLSNGYIPNTKSPAVAAVVTAGVGAAVGNVEASKGMDLVILPDPTIYDGRYANNAWMMELPKPITNMTWDNAFYMSVATADRLGLERKKVMGTPELSVPAMGLGRPMATGSISGANLKAATSSQIGMADDTVVIHLGFGRTRCGQVGVAKGEAMGGGFNTYVLTNSKNGSVVSGFDLTKAPEYYTMANVQFHNALDTDETDSHREVIQEAKFDAAAGKVVVESHAEAGHGGGHEEGHEGEKATAPSMYDPKEHDHSAEHYQWAMTVDLNLCTGCGSCVLACQSENNIPMVGKEQVQKGREMHWLRIDRYYVGKGEGKGLDTKNPPIRFQPLACVHCELAPCEPVCPVAATVHSKEGLNQMVYNRCVGTRYCSNNCPYKTRRFNFLHYTDKTDKIPVMAMIQNPEVTVRGRGVMEKCTYCVQRINRARINAKKELRDVKDGEIVTACQSACPTKAIVFGDMRKEENAVAKSRKSVRQYVLLEELNTKPRTTYLMKITNPNPELGE